MTSTNLLILMSDQHHPGLMGCAGHDIVQTPHMDAMADRGTRFSAAYCNSPLCVPSRASMMTGKYVHEIGYWDNAIAYDGRVPGWGHRLRQLGIPVESIGKLHFRNETDDTGFDRQTIPMHILDGVGQIWGSVRDPLPVRDGGELLVSEAGTGISDYNRYDLAVTGETCAWLNRRAEEPGDRPWVLYVGLVAPHFPYVVPQEFYDLYAEASLPPPTGHPDDGFFLHPWIEQLKGVRPGIDNNTAAERRSATAAYYGLCSFLDHNIGRILETLEVSGLANSTRVIYTSDHGDMVGNRGYWGKSMLYEPSVGIPMLLAGPDIPQNHVCSTPVSLVDLYPTVFDAVDAPLNDEEAVSLPGQSLLQLAAAANDNDRTVFAEYHAYGSPSAAYMLRRGSFKYIFYAGFEPELFDLKQDPDELNNLAADPAYENTLTRFEEQLRSILDPDAVDRQAKADQRALIDAFGGVELASRSGTKNETPAPQVRLDSDSGI